MRLTAVLEQRYDRTPDGRIWTPGPHDSAFWQRYLEVFSEVRVVARVRDVPEGGAARQSADGPGISFAAVPHFIGPRQYLLRRGAVGRAIRAAVRDPRAGAVLLRVPGTLSNVAFQNLAGRSYALEVVGDPADLHARGVSRHPLRAVFQQMYTREMQAQCRSASVVAYVTRESLQRRYPTPGLAFGLSDVDLPPEAYAAAGRRWHPGPYEAVIVGSLQIAYKGVDVAISALKLARQRGLDLRLRVVGDGAYRASLEAQASAEGVSSYVTFVGAVTTGTGVREQLDRSDVFVLPSLTEGLPRALVEAMARGLPALGSDVGGIPELLGPAELLPSRDPQHLAGALERLLSDPERFGALGQRHLEVSKAYANVALAGQRTRFYQAVKDKTGR
jgi:glycosyltransferase involved in cell wall biosynthesis